MDSKKISYIIGHNIGKSLLSDGVSVERQSLLEGLSQALEGKNSQFSEQEATQALQQLQREVMMKRQEASKVQGKKNEEDGKAFLAQNKSLEGWIELPSGLQYKIVKEGSGISPKLEDTVVAHYTGTLINGTKFDSSRDRGQPAEFQLSGLIKGWQEALQMMKPGSRWELVVPSDLAYGSHGAGPGSPIGPNETLKFDIELVQVKSSSTK
jgi:FKBP-type peptidyl-prolyl cis-trans isomerase